MAADLSREEKAIAKLPENKETSPPKNPNYSLPVYMTFVSKTIKEREDSKKCSLSKQLKRKWMQLQLHTHCCLFRGIFSCKYAHDSAETMGVFRCGTAHRNYF